MSGTAVTLLAGLAVSCLVAMGALYLSGVANAQGVNCVPIAKGLGQITGPQFSEGPAFKGLTPGPGGKLVPVMGFANRKTGTFTIFLRPTPDVVCPVMDGTEFDMLEDDTPAPGSNS